MNNAVTSHGDSAIELHCPHCDYIVDGLPRPVCPECGRAFDPQALRAAASGPRLVFETARGWSLPLAGAQTWLLVLFVPWRFAALTLRGATLQRGGLFCAGCFLTTLLALVFDAEVTILATWWTTAAIYLVFQTVLLAALDWRHYHRFGNSLGHWAAIGGYTSAIVVTEFVYGPPLLWLSYLVERIQGQNPSGIGMPEGVQELIWWIQVIVWLVGLAWCFAARMRGTRLGAPLRAAILAGVFLALLLLYSATIEHVGMRAFEFYDNLRDDLHDWGMPILGARG